MEEIVRFEKWVVDVTPSLGDPEYEPSMEEKRLACRILGIRATVHPAGSKQLITFDVAPPEIISLIRLVRSQALRRCEGSWRRLLLRTAH